MKKRYTFTLNEESTEIVREWLETKGQSLSGWVTVLFDEFAQEIEGEPSKMGKSPEEMTVKEFIDVMRYWFKKVQDA